jgi:TPR repeat protein
MAKTASNDKKDRSRPWQRAATRAAIISAARRLIAGRGIDTLSLTSVAREADFAPATVFAYFANKNDLFGSVLADDLATFARSMQESRETAGESRTAGIAVPAEGSGATMAQTPTDGSAANRLRLVEKPGADIDAFAIGPDDLASQEELATQLLHELAPAVEDVHAETPYADQIIAPESGVASELARLREAVTRLETRPVDQWLERRLREFERGLTALEARPEKAEAAAALAALDDSLRKLGSRVEIIETRQLQSADELSRISRERGEQIEKRLRDFLSDIDAANARTSKRLDSLENAAFAAAPEFFHAGPGQASHAEQTAVVAETTAQERAKDVVLQVVEGSAPAPDPEKSYLSAARRSALAAAQEGEKKERPEVHTRRVSKRTLYFVASGLVLAVLLIWTGVFFKAAAVPTSHRVPAQTLTVARAQKLALRSDPQSELMAQAQSGNAKAQLAVALDLLNGPKKDDALAARWLAAAGQHGQAFAAFKLAALYRTGDGVAANPMLAFGWFEIAAHGGNRKAMQNLAVAYAEGWGTAKNPSESARWFTRAASFGLTDAQFNLGVLYEQGLGVPQNLADAYKWYLVAAGAGDREAEARIDAIKSQLDSSDLAAAEEAAASFKPVPLDPDANIAPQPSQFSAG